MGAIALTKDTILDHLNNGVTLIDFWAAWCGPCRVQLPIVDELAGEIGSKATIAKVNVDQEPELAAAFRVRSIPTLVILKDGKIAEIMQGVQSKDLLKQKLLHVMK